MRSSWPNKNKPAFRWGTGAAVLLLSILLSLPASGAPAPGSDLDQASLVAKGSVISNTLEVTITAKPVPVLEQVGYKSVFDGIDVSGKSGALLL